MGCEQPVPTQGHDAKRKDYQFLHLNNENSPTPYPTSSLLMAHLIKSK